MSNEDPGDDFRPKNIMFVKDLDTVNRTSTKSTPKKMTPKSDPCISPLDIFLTGFLLLASATILAVTFPLYATHVDNTPIFYVFPSFVTTISLSTTVFVMKRFKFISPEKTCPLNLARLLQIVISFGLGCLITTYTQIDERVPCQLQDPFKTILIFLSITFYFVFCKKLIGAKKIFAMIIVGFGLFITVNYGICFHTCKEREDKPESSWQERFIWICVYCFGLGMFALSFTFMELYIIYYPLEKTVHSQTPEAYSALSTWEILQECRCKVRNTNDVFDVSTNFIECAYCHCRKLYRRLAPRRVKFTVRSYMRDLLERSILISMWIQSFLCVILFLGGAIYYVSIATHVVNQDSVKISKDSVNILSCHVPGFARGVYTYEPEVEDIIVSLGSPKTVNNVTEDLDLALEKQEANTEYKPRSKRSTIEENLNNPQKKIHRMHRAKHIKRHNFIHSNKTSLAIPLNQLNDTMKKLIHQQHCNDSSYVHFIKVLTRSKRTEVKTNALGFKIIQPTDSILQGHVITTKIKPELVGHVILNKTNINLSGHQITFTQDLFIREHDPQPSKMHRMHRGRPDMRFVNDLTNNSDVITNTMKPYVSHSNYTPPANNKTQARTKRDTNYDINIMDNDITDGDKIANKYFDKVNIKSNQINTPIKVHMDITESNIVQKLLDKKRNRDDLSEKIPPIELKNFLHGFDIANNKTNLDDKKPEEINESMKTKTAKELLLYYVVPVPEPRSWECKSTALYGWIMAAAYLTFSISSIRFLILSQSSMFTIAMMAPALPLAEIWWSLTSQKQDGFLSFYMKMTSTLIFVLIGLPIIIVGLTILFKDQMSNTYIYNMTQYLEKTRIRKFYHQVSEDISSQQSDQNIKSYYIILLLLGILAVLILLFITLLSILMFHIDIIVE